jgi:hypothetical protein
VHVAIHCELVVRDSTVAGAVRGGEPVGLGETVRQMTMETAPAASEIVGGGPARG